jgi:hypothetical protein
METETKPAAKILSTFAPADVAEIVEQIAKEEDRSTSHVVKRLLEESPRVKARRKNIKRAKSKAA